MANKVTATTQKLSSNNLIIVMVLISFLVVGITALVSKALVSSIVLDTKVIDKKSKAEKQLKENIEAAPKLVDAYNALGTQAGVLADALPNTSDYPALLVLMENIATDAGVNLKSIAQSQLSADFGAEPEEATQGDILAPAPQTFPFTISFDGTYESLLLLLDHLEKSARPMRVVAMEINGSGSSLSTQMEIQTFYQDKAQLPFSTETIK